MSSGIYAGDVDFLRPFVVVASPAVAPFYPYFFRTLCTSSAATPGHLDWIAVEPFGLDWIGLPQICIV
tara:strand:+ start:180 stop:383 length:204 start_codon:yes stop_codon:yes gene_type:complete